VSPEFKHASVVDGVRFTAQIGVPNVIQGLFKKRALPSRVATTLHAEHLGYLLVRDMVRRLGPDPFYVRVAREEALLVHHPDDIKIVLGGSPSPFASDPEAKRNGMTAFQPDALTLSRGDVWRQRRDFAEAVLETGKPLHQLAAAFLTVVEEEAATLAARGTVHWDDINATFQRITRRVVFGDAAAEDTELTETLGSLMSAGNRMPGKPAEGYDAFVIRIGEYVDAAAPNSLCSLVAAAPTPGTEAAGQIIHWLFAMGDTLAANLFRTLALLATHREQLAEVRAEVAGADLTDPAAIAGCSYLAGAIQDTMRLWPTTALFGRVTTEDVRFPNGSVVPAGKQVLIYNVFNHRNSDVVGYADRFAPEEWMAGGDAVGNWRFNFFSNGPQGCPGAGLSIFLGQALVAQLTANHDLELHGASLTPGKLPHGLDIYSYSVNLTGKS
jgi:cytochrome P450